jgi:hypothetical protein
VSFGGYFGPTGLGTSGYTWKEVDLQWSNLSGSLDTTPGALAGVQNQFTYDPAFGGDVLYGGRDSATNEYSSTWLFKNGAWDDLTSTLPGAGVIGPLAGGDMAYDAADGYLVLFGGSPCYTCTTFNSNTFVLTSTGWSELSTSVAPPGRVGGQMVYDPSVGGLVLFGGRDPAFDYFGDTWLFRAGNWTQLEPAQAPSLRATFSMTYYAPGGYVLLYGGCPARGCIGGTEDTWIFQGNTWTNLTTLAAMGGPPGYLNSGAMAYDATVGAAILQGGVARTSTGAQQDSFATWGYAWPLRSNFTASGSTVLVGSELSFLTSVSGGALVYSYQYTGLPANCMPGNVSAFLCTFTVAGNYAVTSVVRDLVGSYINITWMIHVFGPLVVALTASPDPAEVGVPLEVTTTLSGGIDANRSFEYSGLGLGCTGSDLPTFSCTPDAAGLLTLRVEVTDDSGSALSGPVSVPVDPRLAVEGVLAVPDPIGLHSGTNLSVTVSGGVGPLTYTWVQVPTGCASADQPTIPCQPTAAGTYPVVVRVSDTLGVSGNAQTNLTVNASSSPSPPHGGGSTNSSSEVLVYAAIGGAVAAVAIVAVLLLRRRPPATPAK